MTPTKRSSRAKPRLLVPWNELGDDHIITSKEFGLWTNRSINTIARERAEGRGPKYIKFVDGGPAYYRVADVRAWLAAKTKSPKTPIQRAQQEAIERAAKDKEGQ